MRSSYKVVVKPRFFADIREAATFIGQRSDDPEVAIIWQRSLFEHLKQLENFPASYPMYRIKSYRQLNHGLYKVVFRVDDVRQKVVVCRLIHSARMAFKRGEIEGT